MISNLSNIVARYLLREKIIEEKNLPVYSYGFEIIISTVIGVVLILLIGVFTSSLFTAAIFYCLFIGLRFFYRRISCRYTLSLQIDLGFLLSALIGNWKRFRAYLYDIP